MSEIKIENVSKYYKKTTALEDVSFNFEHGKIYGFLGRNGAGKSTLINIICNRAFPDSGSVFIDGKKLTENADAQKLIYCMSEKDMYPKSLTVKEVYKWTEEFYHCFDRKKAVQYSELFKIDINKKISGLSTGYHSIFKLIIALSLDLPCIILDEPVLGLDANHRELFYKILIRKYEENPRTIIIATHLIEEVAALIEDVVIIDKGRLILQSSVEDLLQTGYCITGLAQEIDQYCEGKNVIGAETIGSLKVAYIMGALEREKLTALPTLWWMSLPRGSILSCSFRVFRLLFCIEKIKGVFREQRV